jgi:hypothetical protein
MRHAGLFSVAAVAAIVASIAALWTARAAIATGTAPPIAKAALDDVVTGRRPGAADAMLAAETTGGERETPPEAC